MILNVEIGEHEVPIKIKSINKVTLSDMVQRSRSDICIFLSLVVLEPQFSAHEWCNNVSYTDAYKIWQAIADYTEEV